MCNFKEDQIKRLGSLPTGALTAENRALQEVNFSSFLIIF